MFQAGRVLITPVRPLLCSPIGHSDRSVITVASTATCVNEIAAFVRPNVIFSVATAQEVAKKRSLPMGLLASIRDDRVSACKGSLKSKSRIFPRKIEVVYPDDRGVHVLLRTVWRGSLPSLYSVALTHCRPIASLTRFAGRSLDATAFFEKERLVRWGSDPPEVGTRPGLGRTHSGGSRRQVDRLTTSPTDGTAATGTRATTPDVTVISYCLPVQTANVPAASE